MKKALWIAVPIAVLFGLYWIFVRSGEGLEEVEYRYSTVEKGELLRSISATGVLVPLTTVDVKSKAGGKVVQLLVEEGSRVKKGDLIAVIDPEDTRAVYDQAAADVRTAGAREQQANINLGLQRVQSAKSVEDARASVASAKARLARVELEYKQQPTVAETSLRNATSNHESANQALRRFETVTAPQARRDSETALTRAQTNLSAAEADMRRQDELHAKGYVSLAAVEQARTSLASARAEEATARQRASTLESDLQSQLRSLQLDLDRAQASLEQARATQSSVEISASSVEEARLALKQSELALELAISNQKQVGIRESDVVAAQAGAVRSKVSLDNAKVQLDSTTVLAPRDGVVTMKYIEEGTIIPPGTSTFSEGTSLVQISDVTEMYVECGVDEADFASVEKGQKVRITAEAYPGEKVDGIVDRVSPAAQTASNITAIKVRVKILPGTKLALLPGMNATCEFITLSKPDIVLVPGQAVTRDGDTSYVRVKGAAKPVRREVKVGETGDSGVEILSGLTVGEEIVVAEINLKELRETQKKMQEAAQGGGLAGGTMGGSRRPTGGTRPGGASGASGGGARGGGGMGGSR